MSKKVLEKFYKIHRPCSYCYAGIFRDILHYYDHELTENMVFGLMGGINFFYTYPDVKLPDAAPIYWIAGDPGVDPRDTFCRTIGIYQELNITDDADLGWEIVKSRIDHNQPIMIDVAFTDYYISCLSIPKVVQVLHKTVVKRSPVDFIIGGQKAAVIGYDLDEDIAYLVDAMVPKINTIPLSILKRARNEQCYMPPRNEWSAYYVPQKLIPFENSLREAISFTVHNMINPSKFSMNIYTGLEGLQKFVEEFPNWEDLTDEKTLRQSLYFMFTMMWYTGRGFFRPFYSKFLKEASAILDEPDLIGIGDRYYELSQIWGRICRLIEPTIHKGKLNTKLLPLLSEVLDKETEAIYQLKNIAARWE
jgi:hypothetical protein